MGLLSALARIFSRSDHPDLNRSNVNNAQRLGPSAAGTASYFRTVDPFPGDIPLMSLRSRDPQIVIPLDERGYQGHEPGDEFEQALERKWQQYLITRDAGVEPRLQQQSSVIDVMPNAIDFQNLSSISIADNLSMSDEQTEQKSAYREAFTRLNGIESNSLLAYEPELFILAADTDLNNIIPQADDPETIQAFITALSEQFNHFARGSEVSRTEYDSWKSNLVHHKVNEYHRLRDKMVHVDALLTKVDQLLRGLGTDPTGYDIQSLLTELEQLYVAFIELSLFGGIDLCIALARYITTGQNLLELCKAREARLDNVSIAEDLDSCNDSLWKQSLQTAWKDKRAVNGYDRISEHSEDQDDVDSVFADMTSSSQVDILRNQVRPLVDTLSDAYTHLASKVADQLSALKELVKTRSELENRLRSHQSMPRAMQQKSSQSSNESINITEKTEEDVQEMLQRFDDDNLSKMPQGLTLDNFEDYQQKVWDALEQGVVKLEELSGIINHSNGVNDDNLKSIQNIISFISRIFSEHSFQSGLNILSKFNHLDVLIRHGINLPKLADQYKPKDNITGKYNNTVAISTPCVKKRQLEDLNSLLKDEVNKLFNRSGRSSLNSFSSAIGGRSPSPSPVAEKYRYDALIQRVTNYIKALKAQTENRDEADQSNALTEQQLANDYFELKKLARKAKRLKLTNTSELCRILAQNAKLDWMKTVENKEIQRLRVKYGYLNKIGSSHATYGYVGGGTGVGLSLVGTSHLGPSADVGLALTSTHALGNDDEGQFIDSHVIGIDVKAEVGMDASLGQHANGLVKWGAKAKAKLQLGFGFGNFTEYEGVEDFVQKKAYTKGWANIKQSATRSPVKLAGWRIAKALGSPFGNAGSDLKKLKCYTQKVVASHQRGKELLESASITMPTMKKIMIYKGGITQGKGVLDGQTSAGFILGNENMGLNLGAGVKAGVEVKRISAYEVAPISAIDMATQDPQRLREIRSKYTKWLKFQLGIAENHNLYLKNISPDQESAVNPLSTTRHPKRNGTVQTSVTSVMDSELGIAAVNSEAECALAVLVKLEGEIEQFYECYNRCRYLKGITSRTPEQQQALKNVKAKLGEIYESFNVNTKNKPAHKLLQTMHISVAYLCNYLSDNPVYKDNLDRVKALIINPKIAHSTSYLQKLTCFKFKADVRYDSVEFGGKINLGPLAANAKIKLWNAIHPNRLRQGKYIDIDLTGNVSGGLQALISGVDIQTGIGELVKQYYQEQGFPLGEVPILDSIIPNVEVSSSWGVKYRYFLPKYRKKMEYQGWSKYHRQFTRYNQNTTAAADLSAVVTIAPPIHVSAKIGEAVSTTRIRSEVMASNDLSYPTMIFNRYLRFNQHQHGHPEWLAFAEQQRDSFKQLFINLADQSNHMRKEIKHFFEYEIIPKAFSNGGESAKQEAMSIYHYLLTCMAQYKNDNSVENEQRCQQMLEVYFTLLATGWWEQHKSVWKTHKFAGFSGLTLQDIRGNISRVFRDKTLL